MYLLVLSSVILGGFCQNKLPTPPEVIFGGFLPMNSGYKEDEKPAAERNSKSLSRLADATSRISLEPSFPISIPKKHKFTPSDSFGSFWEQRKEKSLFPWQPASHRDSLPQFPLTIPKKYRFGIEDAVVNNPEKYPLSSNNLIKDKFPDTAHGLSHKYTDNIPSQHYLDSASTDQFSDNTLSYQLPDNTPSGRFIDNGPSDQVIENTLADQKVITTLSDQFTDNSLSEQFLDSSPSDQFSDNAPSDQFLAPNILNFLQNVRFPVIGQRPNRLRRPPRPSGPPPSQTSGATFSPVPAGLTETSSHLPTLPVLQNHEIQEPTPDEALKIFNVGLDNFISNAALSTGVPRPVSSFLATNQMLVLPPGLTIEQKTQFLANLDPDQNFILPVPSVNAGVLPLKFQNKQPLILFPPLNRPLNNP